MMGNKNKILFLTSMAGNPWGGSEELWCELADVAHKKGDDVYISYYKWDTIPNKIKQLEDKGIKSFPRKRISFTKLHQKPLGKINELFLAKSELNSIIKKSSPDHVVLSMGGFCDLEIKVYREFLNSLNAPFSLIVHVNPEDRYFSLSNVIAINEVCEKAANIYFVSNRLLEIAKRQTGFDFPNGKLILNPVNMDDTSSLDFPQLTNCLQMACVGRLTAKTKGQALLLQVLSKDIWKDRNWKLNIYGKGPDEKYLNYLVQSWGLSSKVVFHGHVRDIRKDIWGLNHVLIMPSYYEGLPLALVEAMLCERTAVVTDVGGAIEILPDNIGFIAEGVTVNSLSNAMERMWIEKESLESKGIESRKNILEYVDSFLSYEHLLDNL